MFGCWTGGRQQRPRAHRGQAKGTAGRGYPEGPANAGAEEVLTLQWRPLHHQETPPQLKRLRPNWVGEGWEEPRHGGEHASGSSIVSTTTWTWGGEAN